MFVMPPSAEELKRRLVGRGTETMDVIERRMARAAEESEGIENYEYILINDNVDECVREANEIITNAVYAASRNEDYIENIRKQLKEMAKGE